MDAYKINNFFRNLNKDNAIMEEISKQKMIKIKSDTHQNSFWMLRMMIIFFKIIGLATFTHHIITQKQRPSCAFHYSKFGIVYNVLLSSLFIVWNYWSIPLKFAASYENKSNLTVGIDILQCILGSLVICAIFLTYCINQKSIVRIANQIMDVEHEMDRLYLLCRPLRRQRIFCALIIVCVLKVCLLIFLLITEELVFHRIQVYHVISDLLSGILPTFYVGWLLMQYFMLVTIIQADFADVNQAIESLTRVGTPDFRPQSLYQTRRVVFSNSTVHQLLQLRDMHCHLCDISENVSNFYSLPVLFGVTYLFLVLIDYGYYLLSPLLTGDFLEYKTLSNTLIWLIFMIYPISLLTNRITKILNEQIRSRMFYKIAQHCSNYKFILDGENGQNDTWSFKMRNRQRVKVRDLLQLKQFSLQLLHHKVQFTAKGYFSLDNSFFHSLVGTVATYLVILMQFQMSSSSSSTPHCNCTGKNLLKA